MATITNTGLLTELRNVSIDGSSWTAVTFSPQVNNVLVHARSGNALKVSLAASGTPYFTIPAGQSLTIDANSNGKAIYLQGTGADTAEIIISS